MIMTGSALVKWLLGLGLFFAFVGCLGFHSIREYIRSKQHLTTADKNNVAFTVQKKLETGQFITVSGIFNRETNTLIDAQGFKSNSVDEDVARIHDKHEMAVYN